MQPNLSINQDYELFFARFCRCCKISENDGQAIKVLVASSNRFHNGCHKLALHESAAHFNLQKKWAKTVVTVVPSEFLFSHRIIYLCNGMYCRPMQCIFYFSLCLDLSILILCQVCDIIQYYYYYFTLLQPSFPLVQFYCLISDWIVNLLRAISIRIRQFTARTQAYSWATYMWSQIRKSAMQVSSWQLVSQKYLG